MIIDDQRKDTITNFRGTKHGRKCVDSDHMTLRLNMNLKTLPHKPQRVQLLDFKNVDGQILFKRKTSETSELTDCFKSMLPLSEKCEKWFQILQAHCNKAFPIIRIRKNVMKSTAADHLINQRNKLKQSIEDGRLYDIGDLTRLEERISDIIAEEENNKAKLFKQFCDETNSVNIAEMWKLKKTLWPKKQESLPTGKLNNKGQMVTNTDEIKELYSNEFRE